jgi:hypothetical protein
VEQGGPAQLSEGQRVAMTGGIAASTRERAAGHCHGPSSFHARRVDMERRWQTRGVSCRTASAARANRERTTERGYEQHQATDCRHT